MIVISVEGAAIAALLLLAVEREHSGLVVVDSNELHEPQEVMQIQRHDLVDVTIPLMDMDIPLSIGYVSDCHVPKHESLASLKVIRKRSIAQSSVRIRDGPCS